MASSQKNSLAEENTAASLQDRSPDTAINTCEGQSSRSLPTAGVFVAQYTALISFHYSLAFAWTVSMKNSRPEQAIPSEDLPWYMVKCPHRTMFLQWLRDTMNTLHEIKGQTDTLTILDSTRRSAGAEMPTRCTNFPSPYDATGEVTRCLSFVPAMQIFGFESELFEPLVVVC